MLKSEQPDRSQKDCASSDRKLVSTGRLDPTYGIKAHMEFFSLLVGT